MCLGWGRKHGLLGLLKEEDGSLDQSWSQLFDRLGERTHKPVQNGGIDDLQRVGLRSDSMHIHSADSQTSVFSYTCTYRHTDACTRRAHMCGSFHKHQTHIHTHAHIQAHIQAYKCTYTCTCSQTYTKMHRKKYKKRIKTRYALNMLSSQS